VFTGERKDEKRHPGGDKKFVSKEKILLIKKIDYY
jgi:hypothetical protein